MADYLLVRGLAGGAIIGLSAALLLWGTGRVAGISGVLGGVLQRREVGWRLVFLSGLIIGGLAVNGVAPSLFGAPIRESSTVLLLSAFLVGLGTTLGNGCTSGHGVCGLARGSMRSFAAVCTFMATGIVTVACLRGLGG
ncbi:MAG: YeeE/YedE family protein [Myxococcales bacterium FL481]|nr:MAG: YeeE/YedE family protein [Myxococcales bacterium FL481]